MPLTFDQYVEPRGAGYPVNVELFYNVSQDNHRNWISGLHHRAGNLGTAVRERANKLHGRSYLYESPHQLLRREIQPPPSPWSDQLLVYLLWVGRFGVDNSGDNYANEHRCLVY